MPAPCRPAFSDEPASSAARRGHARAAVRGMRRRPACRPGTSMGPSQPHASVTQARPPSRRRHERRACIHQSWNALMGGHAVPGPIRRPPGNAARPGGRSIAFRASYCVAWREGGPGEARVDARSYAVPPGCRRAGAGAPSVRAAAGGCRWLQCKRPAEIAGRFSSVLPNQRQQAALEDTVNARDGPMDGSIECRLRSEDTTCNVRVRASHPTGQSHWTQDTRGHPRE